MAEGWIKLHRKIKECFIFHDKPYDRTHAWIDILLMVNHEDKKFLLGNQLTEVQRGSTITSIRKLSQRWGWSNKKVTAFLRLLNEEKMLVQKSDTKKTVLTVVNYDFYQSQGNTEDTPKIHRGNTKASPMHTNKNEKNEKNDKEVLNTDIGQFDDDFKIIIGYLNFRAGTKYKASTPKTKALIQARMNENFNLSDFKTVIDKKCAAWSSDPKMSKFLRPETLFGTKFEGYLNEKSVKSIPRAFASLAEYAKEETNDQAGDYEAADFSFGEFPLPPG